MASFAVLCCTCLFISVLYISEGQGLCLFNTGIWDINWLNKIWSFYLSYISVVAFSKAAIRFSVTFLQKNIFIFKKLQWNMRWIFQFSFDTGLYLCLHLPCYHLWLLTIELLMMMRTIFMEPGILWTLVLLIVSYL